ncbi:helix-turn-helix domain-containing protein [Brachybacterium saurashtrense]|uniref:Helix-turn-helix domain-containing protein n=2 Tax=Brachybacterium saurashtrense TaxID=556288 RepID=A0A345YLQ3_9MICO|nr:helix-turn-helix domain-containing protein [Brachybacterium saurashtrense]RRR20736.1 helix-turn-helix domain-containing protein [Brachybacterium saurashtrense]
MQRERLVVIVVYDGVQMLDVVGPAEVFATAARHLVDGGGYRVRIVSGDGQSVRSDSGLRLDVDGPLAEQVDPVDTVLVAGGRGCHVAAESAELLAALDDVGRCARRRGSVCTGAFVIAAAGWLTGRAATTHWMAGGRLAREHPDVRVSPDRIFIQDGDVFTSGGASAGMDLALALVEADHDAALARGVARELVLFLQRPGSQSQFSARMEHAIPAKSPLRTVIDEVVADPAADHRLSVMAERARISERHLGRLFAEQMHTTPGRFVERVRVDFACGHLEQTDLGHAAIAARSGFGNEETMRRAFARVLDLSPAEYRRRFQTTRRIPAQHQEKR